MSLTDELQKRRIPASVFKMINDHQIGSVAELAARSDLLKCFESELKPIQWCKLKNMIKDFQGQATHTVSQQNTDNIDVDDNQNREAVLIETEMKASKEDLSEQFHCECEYLKGVISMILDDISCVNEQVRAILERSKEAHQRRATRLKQLLLDVHKFTPDALDGNKGRVKQLSVSHINSARKEFVRENNLRVHIKELVVAGKLRERSGWQTSIEFTVGLCMILF